MSGVWVFRNGVLRLIENPSAHARGNVRRKALFHIPTNQLITSYAMLEEKLAEIGWERYSYRGHPTLLQFHKPSSMDLISLPRDFTQVSSVHMYDIVVKCRNTFEVRDIIVTVQ